MMLSLLLLLLANVRIESHLCRRRISLKSNAFFIPVDDDKEEASEEKESDEDEESEEETSEGKLRFTMSAVSAGCQLQ
jgi:hypothetical protein